MSKFKLSALIALTVAFDLIVAWMLGFTVSWAGAIPPINEVGFWVVAISPVAVTAYCIVKVLAFRTSENTRIW